MSLAVAVEEIARADASCALVLSMANSLSILSLMTFGTEAQRKRWLPQITSGACISCFAITEPNAGSNPGDMKTMAAKYGDKFVINGIKQFISLGSVSKLAFVFALTDPQARAKGISCFLVPTDTPGYSVIRKEDKLGLRASDTCQIAFDNVEVAADQMLGAPGEGYRIALSRTWREPHRNCRAGDGCRGSCTRGRSRLRTRTRDVWPQACRTPSDWLPTRRYGR